MKPDGSAYIVPASVYDEQPISRTYQYRKVGAFNCYCCIISLEQFEHILLQACVPELGAWSCIYTNLGFGHKTVVHL